MRRLSKLSQPTRLIKTLFAAALFGSALLVTAPALAKDLNHRLGVGYRNQLSNNVPSLSAQYYTSPEMSLGLAVGIESAPNSSRFGALAELRRVIFPEDNLNFYMGGGVGAISTRYVGGSNDSGFEILGFLGAEFFLAGLENLGFAFEAGVGVVSMPSGVTFRTIGDSPLRAGITFYF